MKKVAFLVVGTTLATLTTLTTLTTLGWGLWTGSWTVLESHRWEACLGKPLSGCKIPEGYERPETWCSPWEDCTPVAPGVRAVVSHYPRAPKTSFPSTTFAVISLDRKGRIVRVDVRRGFRVFI